MENRIYIVGAGAIGKTLAVLFKLSGKNVTILRGSVDNKSSHQEKIQIVLQDRPELEAEVEVSSISNYAIINGVILLTNKSYGNPDLAQKLKGKTGNSPVVLLQNGLGVEQPFIKNGFAEIYRCVLFATCQNITETRISYKPVAASAVGKVACTETELKAIVELIDHPDFKFRIEENIQKIAWKKAISNSVFNSICPLIEIDNGIFQRDTTSFAIAQRVIKECTLIANASGVDLDPKEIEEQLLMISKKSDGQFISTYQDIKKGRKTEIDTLNFEIVRIAKDLGKEHLVIETKLLGELVKLKSDLSRQ
jgi:2-dehydropantoate 2-reductase